MSEQIPDQPKRQPVQRDWFTKSLAGGVLGFGLALAASGLCSVLLNSLALPIRGQIAMWLVPIVWLPVFGAVFFFFFGLHAWAWLSAVNVVLWCAYLLAHALA